MEKPINPKPNTKKPKDKKTALQRFLNEADADLLYMHERGINRLIEEMYTAIKEDETIDSVLDFLVRKGLPRRSYYRWKDQYPQLEVAHDIFNSIIGNRLFKRINYDVKTIHMVMPEYDEHVWKKMVEYHNNLKKDVAVSAAANANIIADNWKKIMEGESEK
jgi:hypothetical protein